MAVGKSLVFFIIFLVHNTEAAVQPRMELTITEFLDKVLVGYDRLQPPRKGQSTRVQLGVYVNSFYSIREQTMDYSVSIYLRQSWADPRLAFAPNASLGIGTMIKLDNTFYQRIWIPDVYFRNEKKASFHTVTIHNRLMYLYSNGTVWYVTKITATLDCHMNLKDYPLDKQICPMMLESFGNTMDTLHFEWMTNAVEKDPSLRLPEYRFDQTDFQDCSQNYTAGAFPCLNIDFHLTRNREYYIMQIYLPSGLIVIMSWVSFWIHIDAVPARVTIGLVTVLTITTQTTAARESQPRVSYIKAIDVWFAMCLIIVFASLIEYSLVNNFTRRQVPKLKRVTTPARGRKMIITMPCPSAKEKPQISMCEELDEACPSTSKEETVKDPNGREKARKVDKISRVLFPMCFTIFSLIYSCYYGF
ncbi:glycine receptor subunit alpha-1 [Lingula anatina]|uniref:Glycine receptor subunit alpha-1 n=1 Tax=Lingula anatina TaxID=7574 RepID=A0A1S3HCT7_LINAN|nr:glycine receptor subunit alpha-1 [Lingula anatina]XP_023930447.1 glycine receptor subunit alpha-1 [Lingula anatina]XP_023930448.1 glycine receptor subunit alpha-1 [Lingula anatina]|eukprot:XP_013383341.1 glycine receptor subunit alpha-1 [Lingula anatina]